MSNKINRKIINLIDLIFTLNERQLMTTVNENVRGLNKFYGDYAKVEKH